MVKFISFKLNTVLSNVMRSGAVSPWMWTIPCPAYPCLLKSLGGHPSYEIDSCETAVLLKGLLFYLIMVSKVQEQRCWQFGCARDEGLALRKKVKVLDVKRKEIQIEVLWQPHVRHLLTSSLCVIFWQIIKFQGFHQQRKDYDSLKTQMMVSIF